MYPSRVTRYQYHLSLKAFFSHPSVTLSSFINLVSKVHIFIKILMYVLSHGCLLSSYKAFFHLHTWFFLSCDFTSSGCNCLFVFYVFFLWEDFCYEYCLVSHDGTCRSVWKILHTSLQVSILHPRHHSSWTGLPFLLGYFFIVGRFCIKDVTTFIILFLICRHLFFKTSLFLLFL